MTTFQTLTRRPLDDLETDIVSLHQRVTATEYEFLVAVREFDLRQGWKEYCFNNCAEWLNFKCGIDTATGREKLRVAHALWCLPRISAAYKSGELSYSKARSITRLATPENERELVEYAIPATAEQVQKHCQDLRNADRDASTVDVNRLHQQRYLSRTLHGDGSMTISVELTQEAGELVIKALECAMGAACSGSASSECESQGCGSTGCGNSGLHSRSAHGDKDLFLSKQADALVAISQAYLSGGSGKTTSTADHYQVMVHAAAVAVDEAALREAPGLTSKSELPLESIRSLCCDGSLIPVTEDDKGNPLNVGRKHRVVQPALRRALLSRDKCCRFPGCTHKLWIDAQSLPRFIGYHVTHWIDGGETSLENVMLLCSAHHRLLHSAHHRLLHSAHHRLLHEGGFSIKKNFEGDWYFLNARGRAIPDAPVYRLTNFVTNPSADASAERRDAYPSVDGEPPHAFKIREPLSRYCSQPQPIAATG